MHFSMNQQVMNQLYLHTAYSHGNNKILLLHKTNRVLQLTFFIQLEYEKKQVSNYCNNCSILEQETNERKQWYEKTILKKAVSALISIRLSFLLNRQDSKS